MATLSNEGLCNGIPIDHRLKRFLQKARLKDSQGTSNHIEILKDFGSTLVRDEDTSLSAHEVGFASWLAEPNTVSGVVIALLQPPKTQEYTADYQKVNDDCPTLLYVEQALESIIGPGTFVNTSVFDAFPFITELKSLEEKTQESEKAYDTFLAMLNAKKPDIVFACWRVSGREELDFSGKGVGRMDVVQSLELFSGHKVAVVNGFHPSLAANYYSSESCLRRLFMLELCKAFCELNSSWEEDKWMKYLRWRCQARVRKLKQENERNSEQNETNSDRVLRGSWQDESEKKSKAYKISFDNGLQCLKQIFEHLVCPEFTSESPQNLYYFFITQNISEGLCDALLVAYEALIRFTPDPAIPDHPSVEVRNHIGFQARSLVKDYVPDLISFPRGLRKNLWSSQFTKSRSQGLNLRIEKITTKFFEDVVDSIFESMKSWEYYPILLHNALKEFVISFEESLGEHYDKYQKNQYGHHLQTISGSDSIDRSTPQVDSMSISSSSNEESASLAKDTISTPSSSSVNCSKCGQSGPHLESCERLKRGSTTPPRTHSTCYNCQEDGHWAQECRTPRKKGPCYNCQEDGHWAQECRTPRKKGPCYKCGKVGHFANACQS